MQPISINDALKEYFKLKHKLTNERNKALLKLNSLEYSIRDKQIEFSKMQFKCVNCKQLSEKGTIFSITSHPSTEDNDEFRIYKAICGNQQTPCDLNIELQLFKTDDIDALIEETGKTLNDFKDLVIHTKNKQIFGIISAEDAIKEFELYSNIISDLTLLYETYMDKWTRINENPEDISFINEQLEILYSAKYDIKTMMLSSDTTNMSEIATAVVDTYINKILPAANNVRLKTYGINSVIVTDDDTFELIQLPLTITDKLMTSSEARVNSFNVATTVTKATVATTATALTNANALTNAITVAPLEQSAKLRIGNSKSLEQLDIPIERTAINSVPKELLPVITVPIETATLKQNPSIAANSVLGKSSIDNQVPKIKVVERTIIKDPTKTNASANIPSILKPSSKTTDISPLIQKSADDEEEQLIEPDMSKSLIKIVKVG